MGYSFWQIFLHMKSIYNAFSTKNLERQIYHFTGYQTQFSVPEHKPSTVKSQAVARLGQQHVSISSTPQKVKSVNSNTSWLVATRTPYLIQDNGSNLIQKSSIFIFFYQNVGSSRIPIRFFLIFIYENALAKIRMLYQRISLQ